MRGREHVSKIFLPGESLRAAYFYLDNNPRGWFACGAKKFFFIACVLFKSLTILTRLSCIFFSFNYFQDNDVKVKIIMLRVYRARNYMIISRVPLIHPL